MHVGWVGLGSIGTEMVKRLRAADYPVTAYNRGKGLEEVRAAGAQTCDNYAELAASVDMLGFCVFSDAQVREVLFDQGALQALRPGSVLVNHTTGSPALIQEVAGQAPAGVQVLDATFSGGPDNVAAGELVLMVGGEDAALTPVEPALSCYASQIHRLGEVGSGQVLKLLNNLLFAANLQNTAEIMRLGEGLGMDTRAMAEIFRACSGGSFATGLFHKKASVDEVLARVAPYMEKDVGTAMQVGEQIGLSMAAFTGTANYFSSKDAEG